MRLAVKDSTTRPQRRLATLYTVFKEILVNAEIIIQGCETIEVQYYCFLKYGIALIVYSIWLATNCRTIWNDVGLRVRGRVDPTFRRYL